MLECERTHPASGRWGGNKNLTQSPAGHLLTGGKPIAEEQDFWAKAAWNTLGSPMKMTHSQGVGAFFWKEVSGELAAQPVLGDRGCEKTGNFYSLSRLLPLL